MTELNRLIETVPAPITFVIGVVVLLAGGHWLVEGAIRLARLLGLSTLLIGLTVVAFGTSSPELAFNMIAALAGNGELSFGNIVGSNIANIALVLGIAALVGPLSVHGRVVRQELPLLILVSAGLVLLALAPPLIMDRPPARGFSLIDGVGMLLVFGFFMWQWYRLGQRDRSDPLIAGVEEEAVRKVKRPVPVAMGLLLLGLMCLVIGGKVTEEGAVGIAVALNMSQALIGLTIVAIATSLPELLTTVIACRRGHSDLAVGNVVGSNLFNILLVLGLTCVVAPVPVPPGGFWHLGIMLGLTVLLLPMAMTNRFTVMKWEGLLLLACYAAYLTFGIVREV